MRAAGVPLLGQASLEVRSRASKLRLICDVEESRSATARGHITCGSWAQYTIREARLTAYHQLLLYEFPWRKLRRRMGVEALRAVAIELGKKKRGGGRGGRASILLSLELSWAPVDAELSTSGRCVGPRGRNPPSNPQTNAKP